MHGSLYRRGILWSDTSTLWILGFTFTAVPQTVIAVGFTRDELNRIFASCQVAAQLSNSYGVANEIFGDRGRVFVCWNLRSPGSEFWSGFQSYG